jgi:hypothetical protein
MEEIIDGVFHWQAIHPKTGSPAGCHFVAASSTAIDPLLPDEGIEWFDGRGVDRIMLSTRHHLRHAPELAARFNCPILCHESGLYEFEGEGDSEVEGFSFGDRLADNIVALEMNRISPDDTALLIEIGDRALLFGDSLINRGSLGFFSDELIGEDPEGVKRRIRERCGSLLEEHEFEHLLFAHGDPLLGGREGLRAMANGQ